ncbi:MAG: ABC transporter substrate-binding protein [Thermoguttaceae bacterium]
MGNWWKSPPPMSSLQIRPIPARPISCRVGSCTDKRDNTLMNWIRLTVIALLVAGCSQSPKTSKTLTLATTTSTRDSGLLDVLVPMFETETGIEVKVVAVGSGQALELGRRGDADVLLTHAPDAEEQFMYEGHGDQRLPVMHNDFVLVGPQTDPADVAAQTAITEAFRRIAQNESPFISRGDESGTHMKEKMIWLNGQIDPQGEWYVRAGASMAEALRMASEKRAYTLSDRGTFLAQRERLDLTILFKGEPLLHNPYTVIIVSSEEHPHVNHQAASRFSEFLLSPKVQTVIGEFGVERFGEPLYFSRPTESQPSDRIL